MEFTEQNMAEMMESAVKRFQPKRLICKQCGYYDGPRHQLIHCAKCGGEFVSVADWTTINLFQRVKAHCNEENWLAAYVGYFLAEKFNTTWDKGYQWACKHNDDLRMFYRKYCFSKGLIKKIYRVK